MQVLKLPFRTAVLIPHKFCIFSYACIGLHQITYPNLEAEGFLSMGAQLQKAILGLCPSVRMEQFGSHWTDFHEMWYLSLYQHSVDKRKVSLTL